MRVRIGQAAFWFGLAAVIAAFLTAPSQPVRAFALLQSSAACILVDEASNYGFNGRLVNQSGSGGFNVYCPYPSLDTHPSGDVGFISVDVYDNSGTAGQQTTAQACAQDYNGATVWCGTTDTSTGGYESLFPSTTAWNDHGQDYSYIVVNLTYNAQYLHGYYVSG